MKKIFSVIMMMVMFLNFSTVAFAAEDSSINSYRKILDEINEEYGQEIKVDYVDTCQVSPEEFETQVRRLAIQQKELKGYVANRKEYISEGRALLSAMTTTKTVTKPAWHYGDTYHVTVTYDVNGNKISNPRNIKIEPTAGKYTCNYGYPVTDIIDSGRTLTVSAYGTYFEGTFSLSNIYVYAEFYYDS